MANALAIFTAEMLSAYYEAPHTFMRYNAARMATCAMEDTHAARNRARIAKETQRNNSARHESILIALGQSEKRAARIAAYNTRTIAEEAKTAAIELGVKPRMRKAKMTPEQRAAHNRMLKTERQARWRANKAKAMGA